MPKQRLYIDESGDHTIKGVTSAQWDKRYLCLFGCALDVEYCRDVFNPAFEALKERHFGSDIDEPVIMHREDIKAKRGPFRILKDGDRNTRFSEELLDLVQGTKFIAFAVIIDKLSTQSRYYGPISSHPYHIGLLTMLERYCGWLKFCPHKGDALAESRGAREDLLLKGAYSSVYSGGTSFRPSDFSKQR